jgi:hypothetical protein
MPRARDQRLTQFFYHPKTSHCAIDFISHSMIQNDQVSRLTEDFSGGMDNHGTDKKRI